jgi:ribose 5-phosphate isomerase A
VQVTKLGGPEAEPLRRAAAQRAVDFVEDGMVLGFGSGRAAGAALEAIAARVRDGLNVQGVPSSRTTEEKARALSLRLTSLDEHPRLDLTIDGADEVDPRGRLVKGAGGALLREKVLAAASRRLVIVVEVGKLVPHLGATRGVPLEVLPFAWAACAEHLRDLGGDPTLRLAPDGAPAVTDNGNWVVDCAFDAGRLQETAQLDRALHGIPGVLGTGLFWSFRPTIVIGEPGAVRLMRAR